MNQSPILRLSGIRKRYGPNTLALAGVDLDVARQIVVCSPQRLRQDDAPPRRRRSRDA